MLNTERNKRNPAVFLDRDGTIIEDCGYLSHPSQVTFFADTISSLRGLAVYFDLFMVTNQSGIAKGTISMQDVEEVNSYISSCLSAQGIPLRAIYVCPHERESGCRCIKPNPYFLKKAECEFGVDLARSFAVGDHPHDVEFAESVGATGIYVLSGHGRKHKDEIAEGTEVAAGIGEAAECILKRIGDA